MAGSNKVYATSKGRVVEALAGWSMCGGRRPRAGRRNKSGIYRILAHDGGIGPIPRRRAAGALRFEEREEISRGIAAGRSLREIARDLGRSPSTLSREIWRNGGSQAYRASQADGRAWDRHCAPNLVAWRITGRYDGA